MSEPKKMAAETEEGALERFQKLARALFGVDKRDVPKHVPEKRKPKPAAR